MPSQTDTNALIRAFDSGQYNEAEEMALAMTGACPHFALGWKVLGAVLRQSGKPADALSPAQKTLELSPDDPDAHSNLAVVLSDLDRTAEAEASYRRALALKPDYAEVHCNLGNLLNGLGRLDEAAASYRQAVTLKPDFPEARSNLGNILNRLAVALANQGRLDEAVRCYEDALDINPGYAEACNNLGVTLVQLGRPDEAQTRFEQAIVLRPDYVNALINLGDLLRTQGRLEEGAVRYRHALALDPTNSFATHYLAALERRHPESAPHAYVAALFDRFADTFDEQLVEKLEYRTPRLLVSLITDCGACATNKWDVLDLGCGTGLVGAAISPCTRHLVGVDLSAAMLAKAGELNLYQRLERSDLLSMMKREVSSTYDVIVAADVLVYMGKLDEVLQESARLLRAGGLFALSVEALESLSQGPNEGDDEDYRLNPTGRYAHSSSYILRLAHAHGFRPSSLTRNALRLEGGKPVDGYCAILNLVTPPSSTARR